jgi:hypothetical protein
MFTVKVVKPTYEEMLFETDNIKTINNSIENGKTEMVMFKTTTGEEYAIDSGDVWVMNANGKTVADYHMWHEVAADKPNFN